MAKREFGEIEALPSGSLRARYVGPDQKRYARTFRVAVPEGTTRDRARHIRAQAEEAASSWLLSERERVRMKTWAPPLSEREEARREAAQRAAADAVKMPTFREYAPTYLDHRRTRKGKPLEPSTRRIQEGLIRNHLQPTFGDVLLDEITDEMVDLWWSEFDASDKVRRETYALARSMMKTATHRDRRKSKLTPMPGGRVPFNIDGSAGTKAEHRDQRVTSGELATMLTTIRPDWRGIVLLALWGGLRYSEIVALRRGDVDLAKGRIYIRGAVGLGTSGLYPKGTKNDASKPQYLPEPALKELRARLDSFVSGRDGLLFPARNGRWLQRSVFMGKPDGDGFYAARKAAGREDLHFHDLRASGASLLAERGVPLKELQEWLRDSTPTAALRYIRVAEGKPQQHAKLLTEISKAGTW